MCAINPVWKKRLILDVYTSEKIPIQEFDDLVLEKALNIEIVLNEDARLRWHLKESKENAD